MVIRRLQNTEKRLRKSVENAAAYQKILDTYEEKQYIRKVTSEEEQRQTRWLLPHFPVLRPDKSTTKTRIVFDASAQQESICLNDAILAGPKLQNELFSVLLRFRQNQVGIICDIAEMYLQIELKKEDRSFHRFLWRNMNEDQKPDVYEWTRIVFGVNASPFLAQFVSRLNCKEELPLAGDTVINSTYMDDSIDSVIDTKTGVELVDQLRTLWQRAGMFPRKWLSNDPEVMRHVPVQDCAAEVDLDRGTLPSVKTLGLLWSAKEDSFRYQFIPQDDKSGAQTKRSFLSKTASLFDPLGFLQPYTIRAKILFQEMWISGIEWDEEISPEQQTKANEWFAELKDLQDIDIPRCLRENKEISETSLQIFTDAAKDAYGAAIYIRHTYEDESVTSRLVASKSRVAPLKSVSIPRLELMAAVVGVRLSEDVGSCLNISKEQMQFWTDSMDVLYWVHGHSKLFKPFVAHRVGEIQQKTSPAQWRHIPTKLNPADLLTRGLTVDALKKEDK